jgi:hypothetical protein
MHGTTMLSALGPNPQARFISERHLARLRAKFTPTTCAVVGGFVYSGRLTVVQPTLATSAMLAGSNVGYVRHFLNADSAQQEQMIRGEVRLGSLLQMAKPEVAARDRFIAAVSEIGTDEALTLLAILEAEHA